MCEAVRRGAVGRAAGRSDLPNGDTAGAVGIAPQGYHRGGRSSPGVPGCDPLARSALEALGAAERRLPAADQPPVTRCFVPRALVTRGTDIETLHKPRRGEAPGDHQVAESVVGDRSAVRNGSRTEGPKTPDASCGAPLPSITFQCHVRTARDTTAASDTRAGAGSPVAPPAGGGRSHPAVRTGADTAHSRPRSRTARPRAGPRPRSRASARARPGPAETARTGTGPGAAASPTADSWTGTRSGTGSGSALSHGRGHPAAGHPTVRTRARVTARPARPRPKFRTGAARTFRADPGIASGRLPSAVAHVPRHRFRTGPDVRNRPPLR